MIFPGEQPLAQQCGGGVGDLGDGASGGTALSS